MQMNLAVAAPTIATPSDAVSSRAWSTSWAPTMRPTRLKRRPRPYPESPSGMTGVQTLVPIMLDHVNSGQLSLLRFVDLHQRRAAAPV